MHRNTFEQLKKSILFRMDENLQRIEQCCGMIGQDEFWQKPNKQSNSMGHLLLHLNGNISQYIHAGLGKEPDLRQRSKEFEEGHSNLKEEVLEMHCNVIEKAVKVIVGLSEEDLVSDYKVQGFEMTGVAILVHVVEHYSYHTGQIAFLVKEKLNEDLGFYKDFDLDQHS